MSHDFFIGARPLHDEMLRLGMQQLEASEGRLRMLLDRYKTNSSLAWEISQECMFLSQTLDSLNDMTQPEPNLTISGKLLKASLYLGVLVKKAEMAISGIQYG